MIKKAVPSPEDIQTAKKLMVYFIDDVVKGINPTEAGWRELEIGEDRKLAFLETRGNRVRFSLFSFPEFLKFARTTDKDTRRLLAICADINNSIKVMEYAKNFVERLSLSSDLQGSVIAIGLGRMFETSDFPVSPPRVIEAGFNFSDWFVNVSKCSYNLSFEIAKNRYPISWSAFSSLLKEINDPFYEKTQVDPIILSKVKHVLQWDRVMEILSDNKANLAVEAVAFMWFIDLLCEINSILQDESYVFIQSTTWTLLSSRLNKSSIEIVESISGLTEKIYQVTQIDSDLTTDWARVIRLPW